jgi:two-component system, LytTR family, response regulator
MRALIIDDEISARSRLRRLLEAHPDVEIVAEAKEGLEAIALIEEIRPDLIFLDISMPGMDGFEVLRAIQPETPLPHVVFATGFDEYALAAFEANALAYLLKPIEPGRLEAALERARLLQAASIRAAVDQQPWRQIVCRKRDRAHLIPPGQILWFQVESGLVRAHTSNDSYWVTHSIQELEAKLGPAFFRARRETLVNLEHVREIHPSTKSSFILVVADAAETKIQVSERQAKELRQRIPGL